MWIYRASVRGASARRALGIDFGTKVSQNTCGSIGPLSQWRLPEWLLALISGQKCAKYVWIDRASVRGASARRALGIVFADKRVAKYVWIYRASVRGASARRALGIDFGTNVSQNTCGSIGPLS